MKLPTTISLERTNGIKLSHSSARNCNFISRPGTRIITCHLSKDSKTVLHNSFISFLCSDTGCRKLPWASRTVTKQWRNGTLPQATAGAA